MNNQKNDFMHKFTKSAKLQKLNHLQEKRGGNSKLKDKTYKFPLVHSNSGNLSGNNLSSIEIPFSFQSSNDNKNMPKPNQGNHLHSYISNLKKYF